MKFNQYFSLDWFNCQWGSTKGADYQGLASTTENNETCNYWPEDNKDYGKNNYCRNLNVEKNKVWCDTSTGGQTCDVPFCEGKILTSPYRLSCTHM